MPKNRKLIWIIGIIFLCIGIAEGIKIDNLNVEENSIMVIVDTTNATLNSFNISTTRFYPNNSLVGFNVINFTVNASDTNNNSIQLYVNGRKNVSIGYISNQSRNITVTFPDGLFLMAYPTSI